MPDPGLKLSGGVGMTLLAKANDGPGLDPSGVQGGAMTVAWRASGIIRI
jgi:hypothetical protein